MWHGTIQDPSVRVAKRQRRRTAHRPSTARLQLETLEDRTLPSGGLIGSLVVFGDSLADTGNVFLATRRRIPPTRHRRRN